MDLFDTCRFCGGDGAYMFVARGLSANGRPVVALTCSPATPPDNHVALSIVFAMLDEVRATSAPNFTLRERLRHLLHTRRIVLEVRP